MSEFIEESILEVILSQIDEKIFESESLRPEVVLKTFVPMRDVFRVTME